MKVGIVGAGCAGLVAVKQALSFGCEVIAFEQGDKIGGTWVYTEGKNAHCLDVHSSMYSGLRTDIPKEIMGYSDFSHRSGGASYISSTAVLSFLNDYADKFNLARHIKLSHLVIRVKPLLNNKWEVISKSLTDGKYKTDFFDAIFICNGIFHTPPMPIYAGANVFQGKQIHSHEYRSPGPFKGETVVVVGAGPSAIDIMKEVAKTAKNVFWSHHLKQKLNLKLPANVVEKPDIERLATSGAHFVDGTFEDCTVILYCTGYSHSFPFLSTDCGVAVEENYVSPLHYHCIAINKPTLAFIGLPFVVCNNQMFDLQVRFCLKFFTQLKRLPSRAEMIEQHEAEMAERWSRGIVKRKAHMMGFDVQEKYFHDLATVATIEPVKPVIIKIFNKSIHNLFESLNDFRERNFKVVDDETFKEV